MSKIKTVVCRHEQNAAFIAGGMDRLTGKAAVVLVTLGPGCSMGAKGLQIRSAEEIGPVLRKAMAMDGPVLVGVLVDYRDNQSLMAALHADVIH